MRTEYFVRWQSTPTARVMVKFFWSEENARHFYARLLTQHLVYVEYGERPFTPF